MVTTGKDALPLYTFDHFFIFEEEIQHNISLTQLIIHLPQEVVFCLHLSLLCFQQIWGQLKSPMDTTVCSFTKVLFHQLDPLTHILIYFKIFWFEDLDFCCCCWLVGFVCFIVCFSFKIRIPKVSIGTTLNTSMKL